MEASHVFMLILLMAFVVIFVIALPVLSGIGSYSSKEFKRDFSLEDEEFEQNGSKSTSSSHQYTGYTYEAPDVEEENGMVNKQRENGLKKRINKLKTLTSDDIPIKFGINAPKVDHDTPQRQFIANGPNEFDYDVDDFIEKEHAKDMANRFR